MCVRCKWLRPSAVGRWLALVGFAVVLASCAFNFVTAPYFECRLQQNDDGGGNCSERGQLASIYTRSISVTCFVYTVVGWSRYLTAMDMYGARLRVHDTYSPFAASRSHVAFGAAVLAANALLIVPVNAVRLAALAADGRSFVTALLCFKFVRYTHNAVACLCEWRFVVLCYALYAQFAGLNLDMEAVSRRIVDPADDDDWSVSGYGNRFGRGRGDDSAATDQCFNNRRRTRDDNDYGNDGTKEPDDLQCPGNDDQDDLWVAQYDDAGNYVFQSRTTGQALSIVIERFKIRHLLIREAMDALKYAFTVPIGMSICNLCVMALFDIYEHSQQYVYYKQSNVFIILWLTQYAFRFFTIVITAHATTKQALRSKIIVSFMIKHFLDSATKEELQIFYNQISSTSLEFTIYDLFVLKTQLFTSAIGACITYLVIIFQLKSDYGQKEPST